MLEEELGSLVGTSEKSGILNIPRVYYASDLCKGNIPHSTGEVPHKTVLVTSTDMHEALLTRTLNINSNKSFIFYIHYKYLHDVILTFTVLPYLFNIFQRILGSKYHNKGFVCLKFYPCLLFIETMCMCLLILFRLDIWPINKEQK